MATGRKLPPAISVRPAVAADLPAISSLIEQSVWELNSAHYSPRQLTSALKYLIVADPTMVADGTYYVAEARGGIAGVGGWSRRQALYGASHEGAQQVDWLNPSAEPANIRGFYIHPRWARRGVGRRLLQQCEAAAQRVGFGSLELLATHTGVPLYARHGFVATEPMAFTLPDGTILPLTRMRKTLEAARRVLD
jgi:GNAT superfamily N-acetyltransferase